MKLLKILGLTGLLCLLGVSCTRKVDATHTISIDGKSLKNKALSSSGTPIIIMFNLHYEGKTVFSEWQCKAMDSDSLSDTEKHQACWNEVSFEEFDFQKTQFPSSVPMVLQILIVMQDSSGQGFSFDYVDKDIQLASGENRHIFSLSSFVSIGSSASTGDVKGRFVDLAGDPNLGTGMVLGEIKPAVDRPNMRLFKSGMYDGWFSFFMLGDLPVTYKLVDSLNPDLVKLVLFEDKTLNDLASEVDASKAARVVSIPSHFKVEDRGSYWESRGEETKKLILGFFNSNTGLESTGTYDLDFSTAQHNYSERFYHSDEQDPLDDPTTGSLRAGSNSLEYDVVGGAASEVHIEAGSSSASGCKGADYVSNTCLYFDQDSVISNEGVMYGAFQEHSGGKLINGSEAGGIHTLDWKYLPGVSGVISGAVAFVVPEWVKDSIRQKTGEGVACRKLALVSSAVSNVESEAIDSTASSIQVFDKFVLGAGATSISVDPSGYSSTEDLNVFVCPYYTHSSGKNIFLDEAADYRIDNNISSSSWATSLKIEVHDETTYSYANINACVSFSVFGVDGDGNPAPIQNPTDIAVNVDSSYMNVYEDDSCSSSIFSGETAVSNHFHRVLSYRAHTADASPKSIFFTASNGDSLGSDYINLDSIQSETADAIKLVSLKSNAGKYDCILMKAYGYNSGSGAPAPFNTATSNFNITSTPSGDLYDYMQGNDCLGTNYTSQGIAASDSQLLFWYKPGSASTTLSIDDSGALTDVYSGSYSIPGSLEHIELRTNRFSFANFQTGLCFPLSIKYFDANHHATLGGNGTYNFITSGNVEIYPNTACSGSVTNMFASNSSTYETYSMRITSPGQVILDINSPSSQGIDIPAVEVDQTEIQLTASTLNPGSPSCSTQYGLVTDSMGNSLGDSMYWISSYGDSAFNLQVGSITTNSVANFYSDFCTTSLVSNDSFLIDGSGMFNFHIAPLAVGSETLDYLAPIGVNAPSSIFNVTNP